MYPTAASGLPLLVPWALLSWCYWYGGSVGVFCEMLGWFRSLWLCYSRGKECWHCSWGNLSASTALHPRMVSHQKQKKLSGYDKNGATKSEAAYYIPEDIFLCSGKRSFNRRTAIGVTAWLRVRSPLLCPKVGLLFSVTRLVNWMETGCKLPWWNFLGLQKEDQLQSCL